MREYYNDYGNVNNNNNFAGLYIMAAAFWEKRSGPVVQAIQICYTVGAVLSPILTIPFFDKSNMAASNCSMSNHTEASRSNITGFTGTTTSNFVEYKINPAVLSQEFVNFSRSVDHTEHSDSGAHKINYSDNVTESDIPGVYKNWSKNIGNGLASDVDSMVNVGNITGCAYRTFNTRVQYVYIISGAIFMLQGVLLVIMFMWSTGNIRQVLLKKEPYKTTKSSRESINSSRKCCK
eukprot:GHVU01163736.1.p1 GENE.GHVU01163736.1~~GHVU01163736.1.p1  ORF type:complete len:235 (-),score=6.88 GHVU01163736.1:169-873(-)